MSYVFIVVSPSGMILGVYTSRASAQAMCKASAELGECRISCEPIITK